jgi:hypothetical protein
MRQIVVQVNPEVAQSDAVVHAEVLVSIVFGLAEAYLDGRVVDLDRATATASRAIVTGILSTSPVADAA